MILRTYRPEDGPEMAVLFHETVHSVNAGDYTREQLDAWASGKMDLEAWNRSFLEHDSLVAVEGQTIVGFGDMDSTGYLDRLFVHKDYQRQGIASALCDALEQKVSGTLTTHASITARPFFEQRGYRVLLEQMVERNGIFLQNFVMQKERGI